MCVEIAKRKEFYTEKSPMLTGVCPVCGENHVAYNGQEHDGLAFENGISYYIAEWYCGNCDTYGEDRFEIKMVSYWISD